MKTDRTSSLHFRRSPALILLSLMTLTACGGGSGNPVGPSASGGVVLAGTVVGATTSSSLAFGATSTPATPSITGAVTISVQESPAISTTVGADSSFSLRGLPTGSFTLVFTRDGVRLGALSFTSVLPNQELNITVNLTGASVVLLEEQRNGIGHGDLEIEGSVEQVIVLGGASDSRFLIDHRTVVVRPGQTTIRQGNTARAAADLIVGRHVHVKGVWLPAEGSTQPVLAYEIKLQEGEEATTPTPTPTPRAACMIDGATAGRGLELEGVVLSGNASAFRLTVNGNRSQNPVDIMAGGASLECTPKSGPNAPTPAQCAGLVAPGARVHVSGTLNACSETSAQVGATKVSVQN